MASGFWLLGFSVWFFGEKPSSLELPGSLLAFHADFPDHRLESRLSLTSPNLPGNSDSFELAVGLLLPFKSV